MPHLSILERLCLPDLDPVVDAFPTPTKTDPKRCIICLGDFDFDFNFTTPTPPQSESKSTLANLNSSTITTTNLHNNAKDADDTSTTIRLHPCTHLIHATCLQAWLSSAYGSCSIPACIQCTVPLTTQPENALTTLLRQGIRSETGVKARRAIELGLQVTLFWTLIVVCGMFVVGRMGVRWVWGKIERGVERVREGLRVVRAGVKRVGRVVGGAKGDIKKKNNGKCREGIEGYGFVQD
ncbi:hypothetical protein FB567DRAFT_617251 [Paraphoma chrysanthemicola]|uniref:RING-type domain-containing protein n=1 Tax=Paraphoma chrysanthemicola TaxID=798071 RepID=A0A8K0RBW7_9PLEO|nr:hypothetical protein FB567DRAFT_617251 [Paraphoma chrysanthemicola]